MSGGPYDPNWRLPCDVKLPPHTTIKRGVNLGTLVLALLQREKWAAEGDDLSFAEPGSVAQEVLSVAPSPANAYEPSAWQPIETAPKDGTRILAVTPWGVETVKWTEGGKEYGPLDGWIGVEQDSTCVPRSFRRPTDQHQPTLWQPLPTPPHPTPPHHHRPPTNDPAVPRARRSARSRWSVEMTNHAHGSPEMDADAAKLLAMGADPGPTLDELFGETAASTSAPRYAMTDAADLVAEAIALATNLNNTLDQLWDCCPADTLKPTLDARPDLNLDCRAFLKAAGALAKEIDGIRAEQDAPLARHRDLAGANGRPGGGA